MQKNVGLFNTIAAVLQSIHSIQQGPGIQRRRLRPTRHANGANVTASIGDAWGVRTKAAARGQERQTGGMSEGESTRAKHAEGSRHGD